MNLKKTFLTAAGASMLLASTALADNNFTSLNQNGNDNSNITDQAGNLNNSLLSFKHCICGF